jgi:hypothetical protein
MKRNIPALLTLALLPAFSGCTDFIKVMAEEAVQTVRDELQDGTDDVMNETRNQLSEGIDSATLEDAEDFGALTEEDEDL